jgi:hypothetical protein
MDRRSTSALTLAILGGLSLMMLVVGFSWATEPFPDDALGGAEAPLCETQTIAKGSKVRPEDVTVSVFNASRRNGLASQTMADLMERGFGKGTSGNVEDADVKKVQVWAGSASNPAARLVASQFGRGIEIDTSHPEVGVGIVVVVGPDYRRLSSTGAKAATATNDTEICSPVPE